MGFSKSSSRCTHFLQVIPPTCGRRHPTKPLNPLVVIFLFLFSLNLETIRHVVDSRKRYVKRFYLCGRSSWDSLSSAFDRRRAPWSYYFPTLEKSSVEGQSFRDKFKKARAEWRFLFFFSFIPPSERKDGRGAPRAIAAHQSPRVVDPPNVIITSRSLSLSFFSFLRKTGEGERFSLSLRDKEGAGSSDPVACMMYIACVTSRTFRVNFHRARITTLCGAIYMDFVLYAGRRRLKLHRYLLGPAQWTSASSASGDRHFQLLLEKGNANI